MASTLSISTQLAYAKAGGYLDAFTAAANATGIERNLLLAVASRESAMGITLNSLGLGDGGHGNGLMQIDDRSHKAYTSAHSPFNHRANVLYGAQYLKGLINHYGGNLRYALPAYNCGTGGVSDVVRIGLPPDECTTGDDYGQDVLARYQILEGMTETKTEVIGGELVTVTVPPGKAAKKWLILSGAGLLSGLMFTSYAAYNYFNQNNSKFNIKNLKL